MRSLTAFLVLFVYCAAGQETVTVRHAKPSTIVQSMRPLLAGEDSGIVADDLNGVLKLYGTESTIARLKELIALFDVKRATIAIAWSISHEVEKLRYAGTVSIPNGLAFTCGDSQTRARLTLRPRISSKSGPSAAISFSTVVQVEIDSGRFEKTVATLEGAQAVLNLKDMRPLDDRSKDIAAQDERLLPKFTLKLNVVD